MTDTRKPVVLVDTASAHALHQQALRMINTDDLTTMVDRLQQKARRFRHCFSRDGIETLDAAGLDGILQQMFSVRTRRKRLLAALDWPDFRNRLQELLHGESPVTERFQHFSLHLETLGLDTRRARTTTSELLHFSAPGSHPLWTHWIWDPTAGTGVLSLVIDGFGDADVQSTAETYQRVRDASVALTVDGNTVGYTRIAPGFLGTDLFLACARAVHMLSTYHTRISPEFNRFLPPLPELVRRLLGVQGQRSQEDI